MKKKCKTKVEENGSKRGRKPTEEGISPPFTLRIALSLMARIEAWAARHPGKPKTGAAIKMLVERGLQ